VTHHHTVYVYEASQEERDTETSDIMASTKEYLHSEAFNDGYLQVSPLHKVYYHQFGKPDGKPGKTPPNSQPHKS